MSLDWFVIILFALVLWGWRLKIHDRQLRLVEDDKDDRPYSADKAILNALSFQEPESGRHYLEAWSEGAWDECHDLLERERSMNYDS